MFYNTPGGSSPSIPPAPPPIQLTVSEFLVTVGMLLVFLIGGIAADRALHDVPHKQLAEWAGQRIDHATDHAVEQLLEKSGK